MLTINHIGANTLYVLTLNTDRLTNTEVETFIKEQKKLLEDSLKLVHKKGKFAVFVIDANG